MSSTDRPKVGAIRWDGWNEWDVWQRAFDPPQWHRRIPFFGTVTPEGKAIVRGDTQEIVDQEIAYAKNAGVDYWAFDWFHPEAYEHAPDMRRGLELYLSSQHRADVKHMFVLLGWDNMGPTERIDWTLNHLVERFADENYQTVLGNRPLVYLNHDFPTNKTTGSEEGARRFLDDLRARAVKTGLGNPYIAYTHVLAPLAAEVADKMGCDAVGSYLGIAPREDKAEHPYAELAVENRALWDGFKATGKECFPTICLGWDYRPMMQPEYPWLMEWRTLNADWYVETTPAEIEDQLRAAIRFVQDNPKACPTNNVLFYAWNEVSEGGWLVPTLGEGTARLDAVAKVLRPDSR